MEIKRERYQGVFNIIRFNWHFYIAAFLALIAAFIFYSLLPENYQLSALVLAVIATITIMISLIISHYVYDISELYQLNWLPEFNHKSIMNINAGFDETSEIIRNKFPNCDLKICDFYDPDKHTEISVKRARMTYPPLSDTIKVTTNKLPFPDVAFDYCVAIFSAHEIRDDEERAIFFKEIQRVTKPHGQIILTEHLRDWNNFMAYSIGAFHFHSKSSWMNTFEKSNLSIKETIKTTPFITTFILEKNGDSH